MSACSTSPTTNRRRVRAGELVPGVDGQRPVRDRFDAQPAADAATGVEPKAILVIEGQRLGQADLCGTPRLTRVGRTRIEQRPRPEAGRRRLLCPRVACRHAALCDPAQEPADHASHPAGDSPRLCSMNEKSVSTWESNTRLKTPKLTNEAARSLQNRSASSSSASSQ